MGAKKMRVVLGVTGLNAAGKSSVCSFFKTQTFRVVSLSDAIRAKLKEESIEETRENLVKMGNQLRNELGPGALAIKTVDQYFDPKNILSTVVDSVRHPEEVKALTKFAADHKNACIFKLVAVVAPAETRFSRLKARGRLGDCKTLEEFQKNEGLELQHPDPKGQQLSATIKLADFTIHNDKDEKNLQEQLAKIYEALESKA